MPSIPINHIAAWQFNIREMQSILGAGNNSVQPYQRHDFNFVLALEKGAGVYEIDVKEYTIHDQHSCSDQGRCTSYQLSAEAPAI